MWIWMLVLKKKKRNKRRKKSLIIEIWGLHAIIGILCNTFSVYNNNHHYSGPNLMLRWSISSANKCIKRRWQDQRFMLEKTLTNQSLHRQFLSPASPAGEHFVCGIFKIYNGKTKLTKRAKDREYFKGIYQ